MPMLTLDFVQRFCTHMAMIARDSKDTGIKRWDNGVNGTRTRRKENVRDKRKPGSHSSYRLECAALCNTTISFQRCPRALAIWGKPKQASLKWTNQISEVLQSPS